MHSYDMKPYEIVKEYGVEALEDDELLAVFIRTGTKEQNAVEVANRILDSFPERSLLGLCRIPWRELMKISGIGEVKAIRLKCLAELARRISRMTAKKGLKFDRPETIWQYYKESMRHEERERVLLIMLVHNHPSGDPTPSRADLEITERVRLLGAMMEIPLVDHIIIGDKTYCSLRENGYLVI